MFISDIQCGSERFEEVGESPADLTINGMGLNPVRKVAPHVASIQVHWEVIRFRTSHLGVTWGPSVRLPATQRPSTAGSGIFTQRGFVLFFCKAGAPLSGQGCVQGLT